MNLNVSTRAGPLVMVSQRASELRGGLDIMHMGWNNALMPKHIIWQSAYDYQNVNLFSLNWISKEIVLAIRIKKATLVQVIYWRRTSGNQIPFSMLSKFFDAIWRHYITKNYSTNDHVMLNGTKQHWQPTFVALKMPIDVFRKVHVREDD